jgi:hypothetical protein
VHRVAPVPNAASSFDNSNELLGYALRQAASAATHVIPFRSVANDPIESRCPSLSLAKWDGNLKRNTTTGSTLLTADAHQRSDRVNGEREI